tara:strand:+ start:226 stop:699 length:474 start_codon:yes stop_codon:yes gene_type:complete
MREIKEYEYPHQEDHSELEVEILNATASVPDSYLERSELCHIARWNNYPPKIRKFIKWIEETTDATLENLWGVWYRDGGGIKWHAHNSEEDIKYSFVYYIKVPENSSSIHFSKDPTEEDSLIIPIEQGICVVWDKDLPHCVPPSNHKGRCVLSGNLI